MDDDNDNMDLFVFMRKLWDGEYSDMEAVRGIQLYIAAGEDIPKELYPYIDEACGAWSNERGNKGRISKTHTADKWDKLVWHVRLYNKVGYTVEDAMDKVAAWGFVSPLSLKKEYEKKIYQSVKGDADLIYEASSDYFDKKLSE